MQTVADGVDNRVPGTLLLQRRAVNARSIGLGLLGVVFICALTPYNDYVLNNTFLVGNFLPIGLVMFFLLFVLGINAPLSRWAPRHALDTRELAVALGMVLVSCALPSSGLMRNLPAHLVGLFDQAGTSYDYRTLLNELHLPDWIFPDFQSTDAAERAREPVVAHYLSRVPLQDRSFLSRWRAVPWAAWATPALTWGLLLACIYGAVLCLSSIVHRQWARNERLPFPLATVYLSLIESPPKGHALNPLLRSRGFWGAFGLVFALHAMRALNLYDPRTWPALPLGFDLNMLLVNPPWSFAEPFFKSAMVYFSIVGITFFLQTKVAFSLWFFYVLLNVTKMLYGTRQGEFTGAMQTDQLFGALIPYVLTALWIGRGHWASVLGQMFGRRRTDQADADKRDGAGENGDEAPFLPYPLAGWGLCACMGGIVTWLICAGASAAGAIVLVLLLMMFFLAVARVVAETGLIFVQLDTRLVRPWVYLLNELPQRLAVRTTQRSYFFTGLFYSLFTRDMREALPVYSTHALRVADATGAGANGGGRSGRMGFIVALAGALGVGYLVAGASTLYVEYSYAATRDSVASSPINPQGVDDVVRSETLNGAAAYVPPRTGPVESHSRLGHFFFGAGVTSVLSILRLHFINWPLHPVGFLLVHSYPMQQIWFSVLVGWLAKVLIVRFGGTELFRAARTISIGIVIGEAGAAAFWLAVALVCDIVGWPYYPVRLLPG